MRVYAVAVTIVAIVAVCVYVWELSRFHDARTRLQRDVKVARAQRDNETARYLWAEDNRKRSETAESQLRAEASRLRSLIAKSAFEVHVDVRLMQMPLRISVDSGAVIQSELDRAKHLLLQRFHEALDKDGLAMITAPVMTVEDESWRDDYDFGTQLTRKLVVVAGVMPLFAVPSFREMRPFMFQGRRVMIRPDEYGQEQIDKMERIPVHEHSFELIDPRSPARR